MNSGRVYFSSEWVPDLVQGRSKGSNWQKIGATIIYAEPREKEYKYLFTSPTAIRLWDHPCLFMVNSADRLQLVRKLYRYTQNLDGKGEAYFNPSWISCCLSTVRNDQDYQMRIGKGKGDPIALRPLGRWTSINCLPFRGAQRKWRWCRSPIRRCLLYPRLHWTDSGTHLLLVGHRK